LKRDIPGSPNFTLASGKQPHKPAATTCASRVGIKADEICARTCCTYESRHSACGGGDYTAWETMYYEFNIDDYLEGWSPTDVCDKFSGTDTTCSATCCVYSEDRNNALSSGSCPGESI
jgi:hypothetical protein